jgi:type IV pilus assembly protein PilC
MSATLTRIPESQSATPAETPGAQPWYKREFHLGRAVKSEDIMNFSREAASFLRAGIPILDALAIVADESSSKTMTEVLTDVQRRLRAGSSFGDAIALHPSVFPAYYIAVVRAAEMTGHLDEAFDQLATYLERDVAARRQVKSALTYPMIVMLVALIAVVIMSLWVLPKFESFYSSLNADLPLPTRMLLGFTDFVSTWWPVILGVFVVIGLVGYALLGGEHGKSRRDALALKLPGIGPLVHLIAVERFCRVLAALVHAGVSLPDAVRVSADSTGNRVFQAKLAEVREAMVRGEGLARPIASSELFPTAARQMIRVGESTGHLDTQLIAASEFYERELTYRLKRATDMFEPAVIIFVGGVVAFVAIAQISAMYSVYHQIKVK